MKEQRNRKEKRRLHPVGVQRKTQYQKMVLRHGGALLVAGGEVGRELPGESLGTCASTVRN